MRRRIRGTEVEYGTEVYIGREPARRRYFFGSEFQYGADIFFEVLQKRYLSERLFYPHRNVFLRNGARFYVDTGFHPEWATPEADSSFDLVADEKAGELILEEVAEETNKILASKGLGVGVTFFKNNVDTENNTYGCHESYLMSCDPEFRWERLLLLLAPHLISRQLYAGAGQVHEYMVRGRWSYFLSQRAHKIMFCLHGGTTEHRALINTRNEPHADDEKYRRLHIILGDSNIQPAAIFLKTETTVMALDMIEDGFLEQTPFGEDGHKFLRAIREFAEDQTLRKACELGGKNITLINLQEFYRDKARLFCEQAEADPERKFALELWDKVIEAAKKPRPHEALAPYADWALKQVIIERDMERRGYGRKTSGLERIPLPGKDYSQNRKPLTVYERLKYLDVWYHALHPIGRKIRESSGIEPYEIVTPEAIAEARYVPSSRNTRAMARHRQILAAEELAERNKWTLSLNVDWQWFKASRNDTPVLIAGAKLMSDPYDPRLRFGSLSSPETPETDSGRDGP